MIREAQPEDCINLAALSLQVWLQTYCGEGIRTDNSLHALKTFTPAQFEHLLSNPDYKLLVFQEEGYLRGYVQVNLASCCAGSEHGFEIERLYIHGNQQNKGYGKQLLTQVTQRFGNRYWLYTWERNASIGFYQHLGFEDIGEYVFELESGQVVNRVLAFNG